jgi:hypothetical protein
MNSNRSDKFIENTNQRIDEHGHLNISEMGSGVMEE